MNDGEWFTKYYERIIHNHPKADKAREIIHDYMKYNRFVYDGEPVKVYRYLVKEDIIIFDMLRGGVRRATNFKVFINEVIGSNIESVG